MEETMMKLLLQDMRRFLKTVEWGNNCTPVRQCVSCRKIASVFPNGEHRAGCEQQELMRRINCVLGGE